MWKNNPYNNVFQKKAANHLLNKNDFYHIKLQTVNFLQKLSELYTCQVCI